MMFGKALNTNDNYLFQDQAPQPDCGVLEFIFHVQSVCIFNYSSYATIHKDYKICALKIKNPNEIF